MFFTSKPKIFCIGRNKTGTTSMGKALQDLGYKLGDQAKGELLLRDYSKANWNPIVQFCKTAEAFQDVPFSSPFTWLILHHYYPNSKFILTLRDEEEWYKSITTFHAKLFSADGISPPTATELKLAKYRYPGYMWEENRAVWNTPENDIYNKKLLIEQYRLHNDSILHFFRNKAHFIALDVSNPQAYQDLCVFLDKKPCNDSFPHLNKSSDIIK